MQTQPQVPESPATAASLASAERQQSTIFQNIFTLVINLLELTSGCKGTHRGLNIGSILREDVKITGNIDMVTSLLEAISKTLLSGPSGSSDLDVWFAERGFTLSGFPEIKELATEIVEEIRKNSQEQEGVTGYLEHLLDTLKEKKARITAVYKEYLPTVMIYEADYYTFPEDSGKSDARLVYKSTISRIKKAVGYINQYIWDEFITSRDLSHRSRCWSAYDPAVKCHHIQQQRTPDTDDKNILNVELYSLSKQRLSLERSRLLEMISPPRLLEDLDKRASEIEKSQQRVSEIDAQINQSKIEIETQTGSYCIKQFDLDRLKRQSIALEEEKQQLQIEYTNLERELEQKNRQLQRLTGLSNDTALLSSTYDALTLANNKDSERALKRLPALQPQVARKKTPESAQIQEILHAAQRISEYTPTNDQHQAEAASPAPSAPLAPSAPPVYQIPLLMPSPMPLITPPTSPAATPGDISNPAPQPLETAPSIEPTISQHLVLRSLHDSMSEEMKQKIQSWHFQRRLLGFIRFVLEVTTGMKGTYLDLEPGNFFDTNHLNGYSIENLQIIKDLIVTAAKQNGLAEWLNKYAKLCAQFPLMKALAEEVFGFYNCSCLAQAQLWINMLHTFTGPDGKLYPFPHKNYDNPLPESQAGYLEAQRQGLAAYQASLYGEDRFEQEISEQSTPLYTRSEEIRHLQQDPQYQLFLTRRRELQKLQKAISERKQMFCSLQTQEQTLQKKIEDDQQSLTTQRTQIETKRSEIARVNDQIRELEERLRLPASGQRTTTEPRLTESPQSSAVKAREDSPQRKFQKARVIAQTIISAEQPESEESKKPKRKITSFSDLVSLKTTMSARSCHPAVPSTEDPKKKFEELKPKGDEALEDCELEYEDAAALYETMSSGTDDSSKEDKDPTKAVGRDEHHTTSAFPLMPPRYSDTPGDQIPPPMSAANSAGVIGRSITQTFWSGPAGIMPLPIEPAAPTRAPLPPATIMPVFPAVPDNPPVPSAPPMQNTERFSQILENRQMPPPIAL